MSLVLEIEAVGDTFLPATRVHMTVTAKTDLHESTELLRRFLAGDDGAFTLLYKRHHSPLFNYCAKILRDKQEAEDAIHTVWERIIELRGAPKAIENAEGFLYRAARNQCFDRIKGRKQATPLGEVPEGEHPHTSTRELSAEEELVIQALERLPDETREILVLHYYSEYSFEEIALMLGKRSNAIWTRASRARAELRTLVEKQLAILRKGDTHG
jgi:RNA polymerase sigma-70 factor, ECF subfamily